VRYEWLATDGVCLREQQAEGVGRDRTAGMEKAEVADGHETVRETMVEEAAETRHGVEGGGA
jgi:hypothetical protein